jgi:PAS domain S-box-containing protein
MTIDRGHPIAAGIAADALSEQVRVLADIVHWAFVATDELGHASGAQADVTISLIEASYALHRASVALNDMALGTVADEESSPESAPMTPHEAFVVEPAQRQPGRPRVAGGGTGTQSGGPSTPEDRPLTLLAEAVDAVDQYAIFMLHTDGTVVTWNSGARRIKGYTSDEIIGQHFSVFYPPDDVRAGKPDSELAHAAEHGFCRDEGWRVLKDGTTFWADVVITALVDGAGHVEGFVKVARDETDRKEAEERLRLVGLLADHDRIADEMAQPITHRVFAAGLALHSALKLVQDPVAAERIWDAIGLLDATVTEMRTLLSNIGSRDD